MHDKENTNMNKEINVDVLHEELFKSKPLLAFDEKADYQAWKKQIKEKYIEFLGLDTIALNACEIKVDLEETIETDEYIRYRYTFESEKNSIVPCYLLIPKQGKEKYPVCICLQGHSTGFHISIGEKKYDEDDEILKRNTFALYAIKNGYAALCIEQRGMGERTTPRKDRGWATTCGCYHTALTALLLGRTLIGERVWDVSKGIDSLEFFKKSLDLDDITLLGTSGGGTTTYYSACFDERIKIAVPCCAICTYKDSIGEFAHCSCNYIPNIARYMDMGELACLIAPRKLLVCNGEDDAIFLFKGTKEVYSVIEKIYKKEGVPGNAKLVVYPHAPHAFEPNITFTELNKIRKQL